MPDAALDPDLRAHALAARGFMPPEEGDALHAAALEAAAAVPGAPFAEVGSYCGRSTIWLGAAARTCGTTLLAVDHHRGSEENQPGWEFHEPDLVDPAVGVMDTLPRFRRTVFDAGLEDHVVAAVGQSSAVAAIWSTPLALCFIDGGHGEEPARRDHDGWTPHVAPGGTLAIHDVFPDPADGGQAPYEQIYLPAIGSGRFTERRAVGSLRILTRTG
ncbi:class I SAM-dependent methyltransferase [Iamia majanohamensis]|uniref:Class I SAM-dependent methyltransferase n=2 Tax=Iamia majanohamensis TaxID=467976 RepID=A0AAE9YG03_9ACTN|nr:class I SAM-dependent methyltransferase [Iamia majanohamensis]WCO67847.1 class I SAM-dependent methyltransferase [Iamia majanohamensis]